MAKEKGPREPLGGLGLDEVGDGEAAVGHDVDVLAGKIERIEEGGEGVVGGEVHTAGDGGVDGGEHFDVAAVDGLHGGIEDIAGDGERCAQIGIEGAAIERMDPVEKVRRAAALRAFGQKDHGAARL